MFIPTSVTALVVLGLSFYLYIPFPQHASDPWGKSTSAAMKKLQRLLFSVGDASGYPLEVGVTRLLDKRSEASLAANTQTLNSFVNLDGVLALVQRPKINTNQPLPTIIFYHGGGWISGSAASYNELTSFISDQAGVVVISIDYRLAPDYVFPAPFEDCLKATKHALMNADELDIDGSKVGLAGDENGGTLALAVALNLSKEYGIPAPGWKIRLVGAFYPLLQIFDFNLPSYVKYGGGPGILHQKDVIRQHLYHLFGGYNSSLVRKLSDNLHTSVTMKSSEKAQVFDINLIPFSFRGYLPPDWMSTAEDAQLAAVMEEYVLDYRLSPMLADINDLDLLPSTYFIAAEFDPVRDESFMFYGHLRELEMSETTHEYYRSEQHGFLMEFKTNPVARQALVAFCEHFLKVCKYLY